MSDYETVEYEEANGVAWVTLNRPQVHNAFNGKMAEELRDIWRGLRHNPDVNCVVLTAAGEKAFCTGIDRSEVNVDWPDELASGTQGKSGGGTIGFTSPFMLDDPGEYLGPKSNDLWKPVIAAVNGMACGGAFYMLGEVEFIIAADHATFFDPHVSYGMPTAFEPIHMLHKMPFPEIMRLSILGNAERLSATARVRHRARVGGRAGVGAARARAVGGGDDRVVPAARGAGHDPRAVGGPRPGSQAGARHRVHLDRDGHRCRGPARGSGVVRVGQAPGVEAPVTGRRSTATKSRPRSRTSTELGCVDEDWTGWADLFTDDCTYTEHFWGTMRGRDEVRTWIDPVMAGVPEIYTVLEWYAIDGDKVVWSLQNRRDNPDPDGPPYFDFPGLSVAWYAGDGRWAGEEDYWGREGRARSHRAGVRRRVPRRPASAGTSGSAASVLGRATAPEWARDARSRRRRRGSAAPTLRADHQARAELPTHARSHRRAVA